MDDSRGNTDAPSLAFRWIALVTTVATYALVVLGGVVRATESGDACPDWPRCHGELIPPLETAVMIEFSHRLVASLVGLLVLATAVAAWRWQRGRPVMVGGAALALVLVIAQAVLGGMTVLNELPSSMVMAHLALASAILALLVGLTVASWPGQPADGTRREASASFRNLAVVAALATFMLMMTGSYVSGSGASLAVRDWPLFDGRIWPEEGRLAMIHATHRLVAAFVGLGVLYVAWRGWQTLRWNRAVAAGSLAVIALFVAQVFVGAANVWTLLEPAAASAHLALAAAIWAVLVSMAVVAHRTASPAPERAPGPAPAAGAPPVDSAPLPAQGSS